MPTPFALLEARLGAVTAAAFYNSTLMLSGGLQVDAVLSQPAADGPGVLALPGREVVALCRTAALTQPVQRGTQLSVTHGGSTSAWTVLRRLDTPETGDTQLELERS